MAEDFKAIVTDIVAKANGSSTTQDAAGVVVMAIADSVRLYREDGAALEQLADGLTSSAGDIAAAIASPSKGSANG